MSGSIKTLNELIEALERGLDRAEDPLWVALTVLADDDGQALLDDLKKAQQELSQQAEGEFVDLGFAAGFVKERN